MAAKPPSRRFAPMPVETSTKSTRNRNGADGDAQQQITPPPTPDREPRRFKVDPVEVSVKHRRHEAGASPDTGEEDGSAKKPRRFAVEPVESTVKHSAKKAQDTSKGTRRFAVQPVETTSKHSTKSSSDGNTKRRFAPQPVESVERRHRSSNGPKRRDSELDETPADLPKSAKVTTSPARRFAVELVDISARTRKSSDENIAMPHKFRTDVTPGHMVTKDGKPLFPASTFKRKPLLHERRLDRRGPENNARSHSFIAPDLETIDSSESEQSDAESLFNSDAPSAAPNDSPLTFSESMPDSTRRTSKTPKGEGPSFNQFLLDAEAKRAEQLLRDQALAAFPNSDYHEPVHHYVDNDDNDSEEAAVDDRPATWEGHDEDDDLETPTTWRKDTHKVDWELIEIRKHHEALEQKRIAAAAAAARKAEQKPSPWWNVKGVRDPGAVAGGDTELSQMRRGARPPMLGSDLVFPRSQSPQPARFDITQGSHVLRSQMCYLTEQAEQESSSKSGNGLWGGASTLSKSPSDNKGLWGGFCAASRNSSGYSSNLPSGLVTPAVLEPANPFDDNLTAKYASDTLRPPTPPHTRTKMLDRGIVVPRVDSVLNTDEELDKLMEDEYPDDFVTQVFNYLSLGYPTLARPFDEELSKITSISVTELRHDDSLAKSMPKGYIRIGEDFRGRDDGSKELQPEECIRWRALKLYIREWARQEKGMVQIKQTGYGTAPRKGSWAW